MATEKDKAREKARKLAAEFRESGNSSGWFEVLYREADGDIGQIPWADLEPNRFLKAWAEMAGLNGAGRKAIVIGCGLGDDARYLHNRGFEVTAFDISPAAIEWARRLHADVDIKFEVADLLEPFRGWLGAFDFVLEVYTIQPQPPEERMKFIDSIAAFAAPKGEILVITRGREDDEEPAEMPWPVSRAELARFEKIGFKQAEFSVVNDVTEEDAVPRFISRYKAG